MLVAKARAPRPRPEPQPHHPPAWRSLLLPALGLVGLAVAAYLQLRGQPAATHPPPPARSGAAATEAPLPPMPDLAAGIDMAAQPTPPPSIPLVAPSAGAAPADPRAAADQEAADRLAQGLRARRTPSADDVQLAEQLYARYPEQARELLQAVLVAASVRDLAARRYDSAAAFADRAAGLAPESPHPRRARLNVGLAAADWGAAEQAGRALMALEPDDGAAVRGVAYALLRQDRVREAIELLTEFLGRHEDKETRDLLARVRHDQASEQNLDEAKLAHFHVRYDGDAHEDVGREILRLADRHYATLARTFDYQPGQPIPVILLSKESYYDATGAPAWSGGQYDIFDGRVRIPIGGLSAALDPQLDSTLLHEVTHSFVQDISGSVCPRELHEGLAQYMEGRRISELEPERVRALASGRLSNVATFYFLSLYLVEDLMGQRGQGGINDLLRAMAATGKVDEACRQVYGSDLRTLKQRAVDKLQRQSGG